MIYATEQQVVVTSVLVVVVALVALFVGVWWGSGREREYVAELEEEVEERTAALGMLGKMPPEIAHERPWPVHVDQALAVASQAEETALAAILPPEQDVSVTGWTAAMAADMDRFITGMIEDTDEKLKEITR